MMKYKIATRMKPHMGPPVFYDICVCGPEFPGAWLWEIEAFNEYDAELQARERHLREELIAYPDDS